MHDDDDLNALMDGVERRPSTTSMKMTSKMKKSKKVAKIVQERAL